MRRNLEVRNYHEGWKECFEGKILLKQFMLIRKLRGDPKELYEAVLETELLKIIDEPKNGAEADIPLLFHGIHMDMKDGDVLSRVCKRANRSTRHEGTFEEARDAEEDLQTAARSDGPRSSPRCVRPRHGKGVASGGIYVGIDQRVGNTSCARAAAFLLDIRRWT
ncbi:hypothetical protein AaE_014624 [Aphanomyces astaci]|uniref:Uncharacterized protein n=1 Tax=Aphanomyces astaci TaxID=112090 RepID=A0A6A4Z4U8_APHAT|nr:hypothetical protein AaE_014624 [Aphanomyces astaci]